MLNRHLNETIQSKTPQWTELKNEITDVLGPYLFEKTKTSSNDFTNYYGGLTS